MNDKMIVESVVCNFDMPVSVTKLLENDVFLKLADMVTFLTNILFNMKIM